MIFFTTFSISNTLGASNEDSESVHSLLDGLSLTADINYFVFCGGRGRQRGTRPRSRPGAGRPRMGTIAPCRSIHSPRFHKGCKHVCTYGIQSKSAGSKSINTPLHSGQSKSAIASLSRRRECRLQAPTFTPRVIKVGDDTCTAALACMCWQNQTHQQHKTNTYTRDFYYTKFFL